MDHMLKTVYVLLGIILSLGSLTVFIMGAPLVVIVMVFIMLITAPLSLRRMGWISSERKQRTVPPASSQFWHQ